MKFKKYTLDESTMDEFTVDRNMKIKSSPEFDLYEFDDNFSAPEYMPGMPEVENEIMSDSDFGVSGIIIAAINDEWNTINTYNSIIATLKQHSVEDQSFISFIDVINDIVAEENKHVGQLQEILKNISPNTSYIEQGEAEGKSQIGLVNGKLPVQSWGVSDSANPNVVDDVCVLTDVDDEM